MQMKLGDFHFFQWNFTLFYCVQLSEARKFKVILSKNFSKKFLDCCCALALPFFSSLKYFVETNGHYTLCEILIILTTYISLLINGTFFETFHRTVIAECGILRQHSITKHAKLNFFFLIDCDFKKLLTY